MAISPPSDLVLDVVKAADPASVQAAQDKLRASRAATAARSLTEQGAGFDTTLDRLDGTASGLGNAQSKKLKSIPEAYHKFEAMVLQNFVSSMLPENEEVYGKGNAGEMWKSMMAEQFAGAIAKSGGVGIADQMYSQALARAQNKEVSNLSTDENSRKMALSAIDEFQRKTFGTVTADIERSDNS